MPMTPGTRVGPYQIVAAIGAGGMGEVYRARDTKLNRDVAIKVLPEAFAADAERLARFTREAQTLASINHPNIAAIYGIEDGALVMELVEGRELSEIIAGGAMSLDDALPIARQIAEALEAAHDIGIVHRDLKPANIKVRDDGTVKVLDFGLAKAGDPGGTSQGSAQATPYESPTMMSPARTQLGMIIGTAAYMAPEQARGKSVDKRADIWAFGVVLYEMVTGRRVFEGGEISDVLAAVLRQDIDWTALPLDTPPRLRRLLERCLDRDAKARLRDIGEARVEIAKIQSGAPDSSMMMASAAEAPEAPRTTRLAGRAAVAAIIVTALAGAWWAGRASSAGGSAAWAEFTQLTDASGVETGPTISPDGTSFAYSSNTRGSWDIYVQRVGGRNPVLVAGDAGRDEVWPAFSPDGTQLAFNSGGGSGGIFIVGASGESIRRLTDFGANPAWSPDGRHIVFCSEEVKSVYARNGVSTMWTVDVAGGAPTKISDGDAVQPAWSSSGQRIAFWQNVDGQRDLATVSSAGGPSVPLTDDAAADFAPVWSPDGRFLYFASDRGGSMGIWRIGIDEASGRRVSAPEPIAVGVDVSMDLPHMTADGRTLLFRSMITSVNPAAIAFDPATERAGTVRLLQHRTGILAPSDLSRDGQWLALANLRERQEDVFVMKTDGTELSRLTDDAARDRVPRFTPDGTALTFYSNRDGPYQGWSIRRDGGGRTRITDIPIEINYTAASPDGQQLLVVLSPADWVIGPMPGPVSMKTGTLTKRPAVSGGEFAPTTWSRDGRWLTGAVTMPSGVYEGNAIYDVATGTVTPLSKDAGSGEMAWMPDNKRVLYFTLGGKLMLQNIETLQRHQIDVTLPLSPDEDFNIVASPDGRTIYYGARQVEANIWKVTPPTAPRK